VTNAKLKKPRTRAWNQPTDDHHSAHRLGGGGKGTQLEGGPASWISLGLMTSTGERQKNVSEKAVSPRRGKKGIGGVWGTVQRGRKKK